MEGGDREDRGGVRERTTQREREREREMYICTHRERKKTEEERGREIERILETKRG